MCPYREAIEIIRKAERKKERKSSRNVIRGRNFKGGEKKLNGVFRRFIIVFVVVAITLYVMGPKLNYLLY